MSVFGGVGIVKGLEVSEGTVELDALIAWYVRDMLDDWLSALCCETASDGGTWLITWSSS
jgi:hypothetical protein